MKKSLFFLVAFAFVGLTACRAKKGCPSNGKNVGAEKLLSGDKASMRAVKKAAKFKS